MFNQYLSIKYRFLFILILLIIFLLSLNYSSSKKNNLILNNKNFNSFPILTRTIYLFLCENQNELDLYLNIFPSLTSDAIFYCWNDICDISKLNLTFNLFIKIWSKENKNQENIISFESILKYYQIKSRIFLINEKQLNLTKKLTWTTSRNYLYKYILNEELKQKWRWLYYIFVDGDVHVKCPLSEQLLTNKIIVDYGFNEEYLFASYFYLFINLTKLIKYEINEEEKCYLLFDSFLFSILPAIATISGTSGPMAYPGLLTQIVYHIDAMFNAIHHDALTFVLPYCPKYDEQNWWTSQAIFVYRSLCLYGHVISFDGIHITKQDHRSYPRKGDPWSLIDNNMNLVPNYLLRLKDYMKQSRFISPLVLHNYNGWNSDLTSETCRKFHRKMNINTCHVY